MISLVEKLIDPEQQEIILLNSAKKYNASASQIVMGVEFISPDTKKDFEDKIRECNYTFTELTIKDPLLKILT